MSENEHDHDDADQNTGGNLENYGKEDDGQDYVDRSVIDFDPADGLLSGTAIDGTSEIPDPDAAAQENETDRPARGE